MLFEKESALIFAWNKPKWKILLTYYSMCSILYIIYIYIYIYIIWAKKKL